MATNAKVIHGADTVDFESPAREGQRVEHAGKIFTTIKEGLAYILVPVDTPTSLDPKAAKNGLVESQSVFYNPIQQFNRDLSVLAIKTYADDLMAVRRIRAETKALRSRAQGMESRGLKRKAAEALGSRRPDNVLGKSRREDSPQHDTTNVVDDDLVHDDETVNEGEARAPPMNTSGANANAPSSLGNDVSVEDSNVVKASSHNGYGDDPKRLHYRTSFKILDALSATGLRALRYVHEIPMTTSITANDLSYRAVDSIRMNVEHNKLTKKIKPLAGNALTHMYSFVGKPIEGDAKHEGRYDVIDLDPYGTAVPFLDASMQAINDGGMLCVTCTDAAVWASCGYPEKTYSLYGGTPMKGLHSHEGGLRLILHAIASSAARHGMSIEPLLSLSIDFYARVFVRVYRSAAEVKMLAGKTMLVYCCDAGCGAWQTQLIVRNQAFVGKDGKTVNYKHSLSQGPTTNPLCEHCGFKLHLSGPMYGGPLHHPAFIETILESLAELDKETYVTKDRIEGMLTTALEESLLDTEDNGVRPNEAAEQQQIQDVDQQRPVPRADPTKVDAYPFFFFPSALAKVLHCKAPPENAIKGALRHAGYMVTRSHAKPGTIRTNAPWSFIWEVMREWVRQKAPIKDDAIKPGSPGWGIMRGIREHNAKSNEGLQNGVLDPPQAAEHDPNDILVVSLLESLNNDLEAQEQQQQKQQGVASNSREVAGPTETRRPIVFDEKLGQNAPSGGRRLVRYQINPRANWGPMNRAKKRVAKKDDAEKDQDILSKDETLSIDVQ